MKAYSVDLREKIVAAVGRVFEHGGYRLPVQLL
jgi:hypothetical protein